MYFIRRGNRGRGNGIDALKNSRIESQFPFQNQSGPSSRDLSMSGFSNMRRKKTRTFGPMEYLPPGLSDGEEFECPVCGNGVSQNARTCALCKANFVADEFVCPDCGMPLSSRDRDCRICGTIFGEGTSREWKSVNEKARRGSSRAIKNFIVEKELDP